MLLEGRVDIALEIGLRGMGVAPAGTEKEKTGAVEKAVKKALEEAKKAREEEAAKKDQEEQIAKDSDKTDTQEDA